MTINKKETLKKYNLKKYKYIIFKIKNQYI